MKLPILYSFRRCPYAMRARISLYYSKIDHEHREILLKDRPQSLYDISPKGTVPVIQLSNGKVLEESLDIMKWAMSVKDPESWFKNNKIKQIDIISINDTRFKKWLDKYKYHIRYPENSQKYYRDKCEEILNGFEMNLDNNYFLFGHKISLCDMALLPFIRQFANVDINWFNFRFIKIAKWMETLTKTIHFQNTMKKFTTWDQSKHGESIIFNR